MMKHLLTIELLLLVFMFALALAHKNTVIASKPAFLLFGLSGVGLVLIALLALALLVMAAIGRRFDASASLWISFFIGLSPIAVFFITVGKAGLSVPRIHDISTRFDPPILFEKIPSMRSGSDHALAAPDKEVITQQTSFYTELSGLRITANVANAFALSTDILREYNWIVVASNEDENSAWIEAYVETPLFGFKDDIRLELSAQSDTVLVDMRSASRFGKSDLGANAQRIKRFFNELNSRAATR